MYSVAITAFAAMLRALVCHQSSRDHPKNNALMASGFSAEEVAAMSREALHAPASEMMLQSLHLRRLLSDALSNTWAATQGVQEACFWSAHAPHSSARAGSHGLLGTCGSTSCMRCNPLAPADDVLPEMEAVHDISYVDDASARRL